LLHLAGSATKKLPSGSQDIEALIPTAAEIRSTSEDRLSPSSALATSENVNETPKAVYYKELRALLDAKD